jgi:signal peptide peptidase SppA
MAKRSLAHLSKKVFNTPLFITQEGLAPIAEYFADPERTMKLAQFETDVEETQLMRSDFSDEETYRQYKLKQLGVNPETMVGTIDIKGALVNRAGQTQACVELTSYEKIKSTFESQVAEGVKTVVFMQDSSGGEAYRLFGTSKAIRKMADDNGVKIISYIDGLSASASYGLSSIAHEIVANPASRVGSVGVVIQLYNDSKMLENIGIERSFVYAGKNKIPFAKDGSFTEDFISGLQKSVDKSYTQFTKFIATNRNMTVESVVETNAQVFDADEALEIGLIDKIMEIEDFDLYMKGMINQSKENTISYEENMTDVTKNAGGNDDVTAQLTEQLNAAQQIVTEKEGLVTELTTQKEQLEGKYSELEKQLSELQGAKEALETELTNIKADALQSERKAKLESVLGSENDQVATLLTTTAGLEATAFDAIVSALEAKVEKEDKEMEELGNSNAKKATTPSFNDILAERMKAKNQ